MDAYRFIREHIESVPHLEALMLLWNSRPVLWSCEELASRLYVVPTRVEWLLEDLLRLRLVGRTGESPKRYSYASRDEQQNHMMALVDTAYRRDVIGISRMIHSRESPAIREFARAFRFKKESD